MSYTNSVRWMPQSDGSVQLRNAPDNATLMTISASGVITLGSSTTLALQRLQSLTTAQRDLIAPSSPALIFNSTTGKLNFWTGAAWEAVTSA